MKKSIFDILRSVPSVVSSSSYQKVVLSLHEAVQDHWHILMEPLKHSVDPNEAFLTQLSDLTIEEFKEILEIKSGQEEIGDFRLV